MSRVIDVFATRADLLDVLTDVESARPIHYTEAGVFDTPEPAQYGSCLEIPGLGAIRAAEANLAPIFLVTDATISFTIRPVPQKRGGIRYAMDQRVNPDSVALYPGGQFDDRTIVAGSIGTCTDSAASAALLVMIATAIRTKWSEIKSYAVGPEAARILDAGGRLTANLRSPREYDLQR